MAQVHILSCTFEPELEEESGIKYKTDSPLWLHCKADVQYLAVSHVNPSDVTLLADQLTEHVAVSASTTAQVQDPAALQALRHHQAAAIIPAPE